MPGKARQREAGQVSLEILLLASVIIILCLTVFGYYTQIRDSTIALEVLKVEALRQIDREAGQIAVEKIEYKIEPAGANFCIIFAPSTDILDAVEIAAMEALVEGNTDFAAGSVTVSQNDLTDCQ